MRRINVLLASALLASTMSVSQVQSISWKERIAARWNQAKDFTGNAWEKTSDFASKAKAKVQKVGQSAYSTAHKGMSFAYGKTERLRGLGAYILGGLKAKALQANAALDSGFDAMFRVLDKKAMLKIGIVLLALQAAGHIQYSKFKVVFELLEKASKVPTFV